MQAPEFYHSHRRPVFGRNCVATTQPLAAQAGIQMFQKGGNAVDAALATAIALTIVEPTMNGIGGDMFAIIHDGNKIYGLNGSGKSPKAWHHDYFKQYKNMPELGWDSITVPGQVAAWADLHKRFGRLDFANLFNPAITYAREGFIVPMAIADIWQKQSDRLFKQPHFSDLFMIDGHAPKAGQHFSCPIQAEALEAIASSYGRSFYEGDIADAIIDSATQHHGMMTLSDLAEHESQWVTPMSINFGQHQIHEIPPNGQGIVTLIALGILERLHCDDYPIDSAELQHYQIEATKIGINLLYKHIADPDMMDIDAKNLIASDRLDDWANKIKTNTYHISENTLSKNHGTVYLATADSQGMMVSLIQSNFDGFGSGVIIPEYGITMHNRGSFFSLENEHPNCVDGAKRPLHTIIPGFVTKNNKPTTAFGVMGATMQPQGQVQVLYRLLKANQNPQTALDAPRWRIEDNHIWLEKAWSPTFHQDLSHYGHRLMEKTYLDFGAGQIIHRLDNDIPSYICGSEPRRDGLALIY